jgi:hypothetical protein
MARSINWHALLSAQNKEDWISSCVLGNGVGLGGHMVELVDGRMANEMRIVIHGILKISYRYQLVTTFIRRRPRTKSNARRLIDVCSHPAITLHKDDH